MSAIFAFALAQNSAAGRTRPLTSAARLAAIKLDIRARLAQPGLSTADLAQRHGVSARHIRALFQREGASFSQFLRDARLDRTLQALQDVANAGCKISDVAYDAGFGDLSNFNHEFRRRFGATPSEIRSAAATGEGPARPRKS